MTLRARLLLPLGVMLILPLAGMGPSSADEAAAPTTEAAEAATEPASAATEADPDCGCGARSPAQLLETQQDVNEAVSAGSGS